MGGKIAVCLNRTQENRKGAASHTCVQKALHLEDAALSEGWLFWYSESPKGTESINLKHETRTKVLSHNEIAVLFLFPDE